MSDLIAKAADTNEAWQALGNEVLDVECGRIVRNRDFPARRDSNHVQKVRASSPAEIDALFQAADSAFAGMSSQRAFYLDYRTPPAFEARLQHEGYLRRESLIMLLERSLIGRPKEHDIRLVQDDAAWAAYEALDELEWLSSQEEQPTESWNPSVGFRADRIKSPPVRSWLAYDGDRAVAYFSSWGGIDGVGQVENLFTHPDFRNRGYAKALIHRCVADARSSGAGPVVIVCDPNDTPKQLYASLGFWPVAIKRSYWKDA